jgi:hypothetical protein
MLKNVKNLSITNLKQKKFFIGMKTNNFILQERKLKLTIKIWIKNIFFFFLRFSVFCIGF